LLLIMLVALVAMTAILVTRANTGTMRLAQQSGTRMALAEARQALLDFAAVHPDMNPGDSARLPCPDLDASGPYAEGEAHTDDCGVAGASVLGRLPWRTLGVEAIRDAHSACLWYAVSGSWKHAGAASADLINSDSNGLFQVLDIESGLIVAGDEPVDRPVAIVFAANEPLSGQRRSSAATDHQCSNSFSAADFLDADSLSGVSNASVSGAGDTIDIFAITSTNTDDHNDRIAIITRSDLEKQETSRHDRDARMRALGLAATRCVADYARKNPGGSDDRRLPWPAPVDLADYRLDASYDDVDSGTLSGRLPNSVDTSSAVTGNTVAASLGNCDQAAVPEWTAEMLRQWQNWKDHFFYVVADSHVPAAPVPSACSGCFTVNGSGQYIAVVLFGNSRLEALGQSRNAPPVDTDERRDHQNYLEDSNAAIFPYTGGSADFRSQASSSTFNDLLFCIDAGLNVSEC
jgi:hypothetical protein